MSQIYADFNFKHVVSIIYQLKNKIEITAYELAKTRKKICIKKNNLATSLIRSELRLINSNFEFEYAISIIYQLRGKIKI